EDPFAALATHLLSEFRSIFPQLDSDERKAAIVDILAQLLRNRLGLRRGDIRHFIEALNASRGDQRVQPSLVEEFRNKLKQLVDLVSQGQASADSEGTEKTGPLFIFIDELDRCRPLFALELLEALKHLFSIEGIVFVLGLNTE